MSLYKKKLQKRNYNIQDVEYSFNKGFKTLFSYHQRLIKVKKKRSLRYENCTSRVSSLSSLPK